MAAKLPPVVFFGAAAALVAIGLLVVTAGLVVGGDDDATQARTQITFGVPAESGAAPDSYSQAPSSGAFDAVNDRTADGQPLTADEVFPEEARSLPAPGDGDNLTLRGNRIDADCATAVWGTTVGQALRDGGCTQAARGVYANETYAVTVAIFNLADVNAANRAVETFGSGGGFVRPVPAQAPLSGFGQGFSIARGLAMGHFVVIGWVQRMDGTGDAQDDQLLSLLVEAAGPPAVLGRAARGGAAG